MRRPTAVGRFCPLAAGAGAPATQSPGAWAEIGRATARPEGTRRSDRARRGYVQTLRPGVLGYAPIMGTPWLTALRSVADLPEEAFHATGPKSAATGNSSRTGQLAHSGPAQSGGWYGPDQPAAAAVLIRTGRCPTMVLDSLSSDLRTRIETETRVYLSPTKIYTVRGLAEHVRRAGSRQSAPSDDGPGERKFEIEPRRGMLRVGPLTIGTLDDWAPSRFDLCHGDLRLSRTRKRRRRRSAMFRSVICRRNIFGAVRAKARDSTTRG